MHTSDIIIVHVFSNLYVEEECIATRRGKRRGKLNLLLGQKNFLSVTLVVENWRIE